MELNDLFKFVLKIQCLMNINVMINVYSKIKMIYKIFLMK